MSKRLPELLLEDILLASNKIRAYTKELDLASFRKDEKTQDAVIRNFEIIGEAANNLPKELLEGNPQVDWKAVIGFRNVLIHNYFGVDLTFVWAAAKDYLPGLQKDIQALLKNL